MPSHRKAVGLPLLLSGAALAALLVVSQRHSVMCAALPPDCHGSTPRWALACDVLLALAVSMLALAAVRATRSVLRQCERTNRALQPLLALPCTPAPAELAALLNALDLAGRTRLIALETPVALCHGLPRPRLLLSTGALWGLSPAEMEAVLRHEQAHLRRRDPLRLLGARALADALPALPILRRMAALAPMAQELAADRAALAAVGPEALSGALFKVGDGLGPLHGQTVAVGAFSALDARIDQILGAPVPPLSPSPRTVLAAVSLLLLSPLLCVLLPVLWCVALVPAVAGLARRQRRGNQSNDVGSQ